MGDSYLGFILALAFIASCLVFPTANAAEGLWKANLDTSAAISGGLVPGTGESWICRYIDSKGLVRVGAYFVKNPGCVLEKGNLVITDKNKIQFLSSDGGAHSYAWRKSTDVRNFDGAITAGEGSADPENQTYVCRAAIFDFHGNRLEVYPGTISLRSGNCETAHPDPYVTLVDILFDLYSMCDENVNSENPNEYKKGSWTPNFDPYAVMDAGQDQVRGERSYVCRVREDSRLLLGKATYEGTSCEYVDGDKVKNGGRENQEFLTDRAPYSFYAWSPQRNGNIAPGAMHGAYAQYGEPIFICRSLPDVNGWKAPSSPGGLKQAEGVCVTPVNNVIVRNPTYDVLVNMERTCDERRGHNLGILWKVPSTTKPRQHSEPIFAINSRSEGSGSKDADAEEYLATGLNALKLAFDSYASA